MIDHLKALAKEHNMKCSYMNKDEIIGLLLDKQIITTSDLRWRFGVAVTRWSRSTQLLYIEPG